MRTVIGLFAFYSFCFPICYGKYGFDHDHYKFIKDSHQIDLHRRHPNRIVKNKNWKQFGVPQLPQLQSICFNICRPPLPPPPPPQQEYAYGYEEEDPSDTTFDPGCFYRDLLIRRRQPYSIGRPQIHYYSRKIKDDKKRSGKQFYQQSFSQLKCSIICYPLTYNHHPPPYDRPIVPGPRPIRPTGHPPPNRPAATNRPPRPAPPKRTTTTEEAAPATPPSTTTTTTSGTSNNVTNVPSNAAVNPNATTTSSGDDDDEDDDDDTTNNDTPVEVTMFPAPPTVSRATNPPSNKASKVLKKQISRGHISSNNSTK